MNKGSLVQESTTEFKLVGVIDQSSVPYIWKQRHILDAKQDKLTIDLSTISNSDSAGVALLTCLQKEATFRNQDILFVNPPHQLQQIIRLSHLEDILNTQQSL